MSASFIPETYQLVDGIAVPSMSPEAWQELMTYPLRPDDVILSGYPRSGTTWLQQIVRQLRHGVGDDGVNLDDAVPLLDVLKAKQGQLRKLNPNAAYDLPSPRTMKVHLPYQFVPRGMPHTTNIKYVYIARNPKDQSVSFWHFIQTQIGKAVKVDKQSWESFLLDHLEAKGWSSCNGGWLDHVLGWWEHRDAPNILFLKYENLQREPYKMVETIGRFIGVEPLTEDLIETVVEKSSFQSMEVNTSINNRKREGVDYTLQYLRKGVVGDWKNHYTTEQNILFEEKIGETLKKNGLEFDYE